MTLTSQIVNLYEKLHYDLETISTEIGYPVEDIKAVLLQYSSLFRKDAKKDASLEFNEDEQALAKQAMVELLQTSEDENVRFRVAKYLRNDAKGRLDINANLNALRIDVFAFNEAMQKARLAKAATFKELKPIDVEVTQEEKAA